MKITPKNPLKFARQMRNKSEQESEKWSEIISHPAKYEEYQRHYYKDYAHKHKNQLLANPTLTRGESLSLMTHLIHQWSPLHKLIAFIILIIFIYFVVFSFI